MTSDDYIDVAIIVLVAWGALTLLNKAGAFVQGVSNEVSNVTNEVASIL